MNDFRKSFHHKHVKNIMEKRKVSLVCHLGPTQSVNISTLRERTILILHGDHYFPDDSDNSVRV